MSDLIIFSGLPGVGKSTLAYRLARELQYPLLCIDDVIGDVPEDAGFAFWDSKIMILLGVAEKQLELSLNVIVDSVFMNLDRHHAQSLAKKYNARFRPIYVYVSDEKLWKQRVTERFQKLNDDAVATWERIQHQRRHFRDWQLNTALFVDNAQPPEQNYADVLRFATSDKIALDPLEDIPWAPGKYHE